MATGYGNVRVGDADREATAAQLREHYADGRLTLDELNERLDQTFAAKTTADLSTVTRDLPHAMPTGTPAFGWPGSAGAAGSGPMANQGSWDYRHGDGDQQAGARRPFAAFAPLMGMVWLFVIIGAFSLFGLGGGGRPFAVVLFLAALGLFRRLIGMSRRRGMGGPRGPRGPRGSRRW